MSVLRSAMLAVSENAWLRERAARAWFVRKSVSRFMPGERLEDALAAATALNGQRMGAVLTRLGENITDVGEADETTRHYAHVIAQIRERGLAAEISVKLTQLGLDADAVRCHANVRSLVEQANAHDAFVWIDMEQFTYVDRTLNLYRQLVGEFPNVGVCLQAYLFRTASDLASLLSLGGGIRLVKGAYREPANIAMPRKRDVDDNYRALARQMIGPVARTAGLRAVFGTHDRAIIADLARHAADASLPRDAYEFHLLFGIQRGEQSRLARDGHRVSVLVSYGDQWFPWYMRRLAERPANMWFVVKAIVSK